MMQQGTVLITGVTGFVGSALASCLLRDKEMDVRGIARRAPSFIVPGVELFTADLAQGMNVAAALSEVDCVVHCAAMAHVMRETETDALAVYRRINVEATRNIASQAANAGVRRFVYLSSIKVNGESTRSGYAFHADDVANVDDPYSISKREAEQALQEIAASTGMEVVIIRPPLVYGPRVKGNFRSMLKWLSNVIPLPLGAINNKRSMVGLDNLVDLLITCVDHPSAANQTFLVSDDEDLSTTELLRRMSKALGKSVRLVPVPVSLLQLGAKLLGKQDIAQRLLGNLQIDVSHAKKVLDWTPPVNVDEGRRRTAEWYLSQK